MKFQDLTFSEKLKLCKNLLHLLKSLKNSEKPEFNSSNIDELIKKLEQWNRELKVRKFYYDL